MQVYAPLNSEPQPELQRVEIASSFQIPGLHIIGLPAPEVSEARERIRAAMESCGFELPKRRVVLNLAPASIRKRGTGLDLAMALAVLSLNLESIRQEKISAWGELSLDGSIQPAGQLTRSIYSAWQGGVTRLYLCADEVLLARQIVQVIHRGSLFSTPPPQLIPVSSLSELWSELRSPASISQLEPAPISIPDSPQDSQPSLLPLPTGLERPICISALGGHHLLLLGSKGTGKSQALEWLVALQPENSERMKIHHMLLLELAKGGTSNELSTPVRRVSSSVRAAALIGSCSSGLLRPGEFSLAHGGLLIADEFPEWSRDSREALREPLERGVITLTRSKASIEFPARFSFAANGNLCPCGGWPSEYPIPLEAERDGIKIPRCRCTQAARNQYSARMSGPVMDRLDVVLLVGVSKADSRDRRNSSRVQRLKDQVSFAREQACGLWGSPPGMLNANALEDLLEEHSGWRAHLDQLQLVSLRARHKTLRVALSLAIWDGLPEPRAAHFMEASCYRPERFGLCE